MTLVPKSLFTQFSCMPQLFLLTQVIIQQFPVYSSYALYSTGIPLILLISFNLFKDCLSIYHGKKRDSIINDSECFVWNGNLFKPEKSESVLVGQLVKVFDQEKSLSDVLVLYSSNQDGCFYADYDGLVGNVEIKTQKAVYETQCLLANDLTCIESLSGKITFQEPTNDYLNFKGKLNLDKNPKVVELNFKNMLYRNSKLIRTGFVIGVVIYAGIETKSFFNIKKRKNKRNVANKKLSNFYIVLFILYTALVLFTVFKSASSSSSPVDLYIFQFTMSKFSFIVPSFLLILLDLSRLMQILLTRQSMKRKSWFTSIDINENLGKIEYIVTSTAGTLTESLIQVKACMIGSDLYTDDGDIESKSSSQPDDTSINLHNPSLSLSSLHKHFDQADVQEFFLLMSLCNSVTVNSTSNSELFTLSREDLAMIAICKEFNVQLVEKTSQNLTIEIKKNRVKANVVASSKGRNSRILLEKDGKLSLLVRGTIDHMLHLIQFEDSKREKLIEKFSYISSKGFQIYILGKRKYKEIENSRTLSKINHARSLPRRTNTRIEKFFRKNEKKLEYVGMFALEDQVLPESQDAVWDLRVAGVKIWAASGESKFSAVATCRRSGLFDPQTPIVHLRSIKNYPACIKLLASCLSRYVFQESEYENSEVMTILQYKSSKVGDMFSSVGSSDMPNLSIDTYGKMYEEAELTHKMSIVEEKLLEIIDRDYDSFQIKYNLVVDREFLKIALNYPYTQKMLSCLLFAADSVCFVKLMSQDKADVVELIQKNFKFRPFVLALGDKETDIPMMQQADVGVCAKRSESKEPQCYADVVIEHFEFCKDLVLVYGNWNLNRVSRLVLLGIYLNVFVGFLMFLQMFLADFWVFEGFDLIYFWFFNYVIASLPLLLIGSQEGKMNKFELLGNLGLYTVGNVMEEISFKSFGFYVLIGVLDALIVFNLSNLCFLSIINLNGFTEDNGMVSIYLFILVVLTSLLQLASKTSFFSSLVMSIYLICLVFLVFVVLISQKVLFDDEGLGSCLLNSPLLLVNLITIPAVCFLVNCFVEDCATVCFRRKVRNRLEEYEGKLSSVYRDRDLTKQTVKDIYDLNPYKIKFYSPHVETDYQQKFIHSNIRHLKIVTIIFVSLYLIWTIIEPLIVSLNQFYIVLRSITAVFLIFFTILTRTHFFKTNFRLIFLFLFTTALLYKLLVEIFFINVSILLPVLIPVFTFIFLNFEWLKITALNIINFLLYIIEIYWLYNQKLESYEKLISILTLFSIILTLAFLARTLEKTSRMQFKLIRLQEITYEKTQRILSFLLPSFVKKKVKDGVRYIAEDQGTVTVLFCDISDFDMIIAEYSTSEMITFLDTFYQRLDILCTTHGVTKIETVGKTYMACSGLRDSELEMDSSITSLHHSKRALNLAFAILEETKKFILKTGSRLQVKIGVHSGQVTAGVVGYHKPQFSLVGDTVNTASRMCSTLEIDNAIQISAETYENAPEFLSNKFAPNRIFAKGKGMLDTWVHSANGLWECWNFLDELTSYKTTSALSSALNTEKTESRSATKDKGMMGFMDETFRMDTVYLQSSKCCYCNLTESDKEKRFRLDKLESNKEVMRFGLVVAFLYFLITLCMELSLHVKRLSQRFEGFLLRSAAMGLILVLVFGFKNWYKNRVYGLVVYFSILMILADLILAQINFEHDFKMTTMNFMYLLIILNHLTGFSYVLIFWLQLPMLLAWVSFALLFERSNSVITTIIFLILFALINISAVYIRENQLRNYFNLKGLTEKDMAKTEKLLIQMMPPHVLENMKNNKAFTDKLYDVTLLYADIVGFTSWSSNKSPKEVVEMLSNLFTRFDKLCVIHKVYKVHTIGDCYVVMGYLDSKDRDPHNECNSIVNMALSMISVIERANREQGIDLKMRIGIHTGNIIAGIIGTNIVRYDIYGPDVLIANKMESGGEAGKINISDVTKRFLQENCMGDYSFAVNKEIMLKSINRKHMSYFLSVN